MRTINFVFIIILVVVPTISYSQSENISLSELSSFTLKDFDKIEATLKNYSYNFIGAEKTLFRGIECTNYNFERRNEKLYNLQEVIALTKYNQGTDKTYKISYTSLSEKVFDLYKSEVVENSSTKFVKEFTQGDAFHRIYKYNLCEYDFIVAKSQIPDNPLHIVLITF